MKYGLVLAGGGMRGLFSAGVIDVLMENDIKFDALAGVSAGAAFGCNYKSGQIRRVIRYSTRFCKDKRFCSFHSLVKTGDLFGADFCYHAIPEKLDIFDNKTFDASTVDFWVVCTDVNTGKPVYHKCGPVSYDEFEWIRASSSMPMAARIVDVGGYSLLDGGLSDAIPLKFMESRGCEKNVVVLTQPRDYFKKPERLTGIMKLKYRKYPELVRAARNRHKMYNSELKYIKAAEQEGRAFVIAPPEKLPIGRIGHDADVMLEVYRMGRCAANEQLKALKAFME